MRTIKYLIAACFTIFLASCVDTTEDINLKEDGSGMLTYSMDLSKLLTMMGQMGGSDNPMANQKDQDTTIAFSSFVDSVKNLTPQEKQLMRPGKMHLVLKMKDEKFSNTMTFPFKKTEELKVIKAALPKIITEAFKKMGSDKAGDMPAGMDDEMPKPKNFDDFYDFDITSHSITKQLNKDRYATVDSDKGMQAIQQMNSMGAPMNLNYVFNLPRAAKSAEGKNVKLSDDKKKVTINVTSEDFFDDPKKFEYKIEY